MSDDSVVLEVDTSVIVNVSYTSRKSKVVLDLATANSNNR